MKRLNYYQVHKNKKAKYKKSKNFCMKKYRFIQGNILLFEKHFLTLLKKNVQINIFKN